MAATTSSRIVPRPPSRLRRRASFFAARYTLAGNSTVNRSTGSFTSPSHAVNSTHRLKLATPLKDPFCSVRTSTFSILPQRVPQIQVAVLRDRPCQELPGGLPRAARGQLLLRVEHEQIPLPRNPDDHLEGHAAEFGAHLQPDRLRVEQDLHRAPSVRHAGRLGVHPGRTFHSVSHTRRQPQNQRILISYSTPVNCEGPGALTLRVSTFPGGTPTASIDFLNAQ